MSVSLSLKHRKPKPIVKHYKTLMQVEEGFRDCKSVHYGFGLSQNRFMNIYRRTVTCLLIVSYLICGVSATAGKDTGLTKQVRVTSSIERLNYSVIFFWQGCSSHKHNFDYRTEQFNQLYPG